MVRLFSRVGESRDGDFARSSGEIAQFARAYRDRNVYVAPNPTAATGGARHSARDVTHWSYFLIDMDPVEEKYNARAALQIALDTFGDWVGVDFRERVPVIIDSGRGTQAWIRLDDIPLGDPRAVAGGIEHTHARRVNGYWLKRLDEYLAGVFGCRIDTSVSDLPRVMRCPGTTNVKTGQMAQFVTASAEKYSGLAELLARETPSKALEDPEPTEGVPAGQSWQMVYPHLTRMAQVYLTQGQEEPGRHKVMWHTARKFRELGVERPEAERALRWANGLRGSDEALPPEQVRHALDTAYLTE